MSVSGHLWVILASALDVRDAKVDQDLLDGLQKQCRYMGGNETENGATHREADSQSDEQTDRHVGR